MPLTDGQSQNSISIDRIAANDAVLEFIAGEQGREPFKLNFQKLVLDHVAEDGPVSFHAAVINTQPPGTIVASGQFGPWNARDPGATLLSGSYTFDNGTSRFFTESRACFHRKGNSTDRYSR